MTGTDLAQCRDLGLAPRLGVGTARMKSTARRRIDGTRNVALQQLFLAPDPRIGDRHGSQQGFGVGMQGAREQRLLVGVFDDLAEIHDRDAVTDVLDHG